MTTSFNFQDTLKWSSKKNPHDVWETEVKKGRQRVKVRLNAQKNDAAFTVVVQKDLLGRFLDLFKKKATPSPIQENTCLLSKTFENVDFVKFAAEKKRLADLIKRKTSLDEIISTITRDFSREISMIPRVSTDHGLVLPELPKDVTSITFSNEPSTFGLGDPELPNEDVNPNLNDLNSDHSNLAINEEENEKLAELQKCRALLEKEIESLQREINEAKETFEESLCFEAAIKVQDIALKKIEELQTSLENLLPKDESPKNEKLKENIASLSSNIQDFQSAVMQKMISDINIKAQQVSSNIALCSDTIRENFEKQWSKLENDLEPVFSIEDAKKKENHLNQLIEDISEEHKKELLEAAFTAKGNLDHVLSVPLSDMVSSKEWLSSINELRSFAAQERQKAWEALEFDIRNATNILGESENLKSIIENETVSDRVLEQSLNKLPRASTYKAMAFEAAKTVTSYAAYLVSDIFKPFMTFEPQSLSESYMFNDVMISYLKKASENLDEKDLRVLVDVFSSCHHRKKQEAVNMIEEELKAVFQAGMCTSILGRGQQTIEILRSGLESNQNSLEFIESLKKLRKTMTAQFQDLQALDVSALLHDHYKKIIHENKNVIESMTGNEKIQAETVLEELEGKLISELEWLSKLNEISQASVETIKYKLEDVQLVLNGFFKIEEQKRTVRKEIEEGILQFDEFIMTYKEKVSELEDQYGVNLESASLEIEKASMQVHECKDEKFLNLNLKELIATQNRLHTATKDGVYAIEVSSKIGEAYKAMMALQVKEEEGSALKNEFKFATGARNAQIFNALQLDKKLKSLILDKKDHLDGKTLSTKELIQSLQFYTFNVKDVISHAHKMQILSFQQQIKKFEDQIEGIQKTLNATPSPKADVVQKLDEELNEIKSCLTNAKKTLIKSLEMKLQDHRKTMTEVCRPLRMSGEIFVKAQALIAETENNAVQKINNKALKEHMEGILSFTRLGSFQQDSIELDVLETINAEDFRNFESIIENMVEVNLKHAVLIRESTLAAEKAKQNFHIVREKAIAMADDLSENDQFVEKAILEKVLQDIEKDVEKLSLQNYEDTKPDSFLWDLSHLNFAALWNKTAYEVTKATEKQKTAYGAASGKLLNAIDRSKAAPVLSIPDQLLDLSYIPKEKLQAVETEMRTTFSKKMKDMLRHAEIAIDNYESSFSDIIGRYYVVKTGRFRNDIEELIKYKRVELNSLKKEYSNTFWWVPRKPFEYFNLVKMRESISEMTPSVMRSYEKEVTAFTKNIKASLDRSFPVLNVAKSHKNFENAFLKAKSEAAQYRANGQFLHAYRVEKEAILVNEAFKKEWDRPKVTGLGELRALNAELLKCAGSIERQVTRVKMDARTPISLSVQLDKLNQESPESRDAYDALKTNKEALKEDAIETIKSKIKDHREDLVNASSDFKEIAEKFNFPSNWTSKIDEAVGKELDLYSEDYSISKYIFFSKNIEDFTASEAAVNANKIVKDCSESLKRAFLPKGIGVDVDLKGLRESYKKYKAVMTKVDSTRDNLIRQGQYLYVSKLEADVKNADDAFKALDENLSPSERIKEVKDALSYRAKLLNDAERIANTSKILTAKEQAAELPNNFLYHDELQVYRADQIKVKTEKQCEEITKQIEILENIQFFPSEWSQVIVVRLKQCKDQMRSVENGITVWDDYGNTTIKLLEEITSEEITLIENLLEMVERKLQDIERTYGVKDLLLHDQARIKLLQEAEDLKAKVSISQSLDIDHLLTIVKGPIIECIMPIPGSVMADRIREFADTLRIQNAVLNTGLKKIQGDRPSSGAARLFTLKVDSAEYIKCKKGLQEFTAQQLLSLHKAIDLYDQRIDEIEKKFQAITSAETVLTQDWKRDAYAFIRKRKDYVSKLQEGLPHIAANGPMQVKPFNALTCEELVHYEKIVMLYVGSQTTFVPEKDKNSDEYSKLSALSILENTLHLVDLEKTVNSLTLQVNRLKANVTHAERANQDPKKFVTLNAGKEVFKKLIAFTAGSLTKVAHTQTMRDVLEFVLASMSKMNLEVSSSDRNFGALSIDPWVALYMQDKDNDLSLKEQATADLYDNGYEVRYKTYFNEASRGSGWDDKVHYYMTPRQARERAQAAVEYTERAAREKKDLRAPEHPKVKFMVRIEAKCRELSEKLDAIGTDKPDVRNEELFNQHLQIRTEILKQIDEVFGELNAINIEAVEGMGMTAEDELSKPKRSSGLRHDPSYDEKQPEPELHENKNDVPEEVN